MLSLHLYAASDGRGGPPREHIHQVLRRHGALLHASTDDYSSGYWQDADTRAYVDIDSGPLPLHSTGPATTHHDDPNAQPKDYPGWTTQEVSFQIPLNGPHWFVVDIAQWLEGVLAELPGTGLLINEDTGLEGEPGYGPGAVDRLRILRCWEYCHMEQCASLATPMMARNSSLALWRYRREYAANAARHANYSWPQALVLARQEQAYPVTVWQDCERRWALPPVEYVVIQRGEETGLLPSDEILTAAGEHAQILASAAAHAISPCPALQTLFNQARLMSPENFRHCHDHDWSDTPIIASADDHEDRVND